MKRDYLYIAVDFDGTCVENDFPRVGKSVHAEPVLKALVDSGHKLILWTCRADEGLEKLYLTSAVRWFALNDIPLFGINCNPEFMTSSPKVYADIYIDDRNPFTPMHIGSNGKSHVSWVDMLNELSQSDIINNVQYNKARNQILKISINENGRAEQTS